MFDDVHYINKGWINRNQILVNDSIFKFSIPLQKASQHILIKDLFIISSDKWKFKLLKTIEFSYKKAPFFHHTMDLVRKLFSSKSNLLMDWHLYSFDLIMDYLNINTKLIRSSEIILNNEYTGQDRIIDICKQLHATHYINPISGQSLYQKDAFEQNGINCSFLVTKDIKYQQFSASFMPQLSILDLLMFNSSDFIRNKLLNFDLM